jgi:ADP-heptose:LPS heptosyltransferase
VGRLRRRRYDVALDFQGLLKSAVLARLSGATRVVGFDRAGLREGAAAAFYRERVAVDPGTHVIDKNLGLAAAVGSAPGTWEFPIAPVSSAALDAVRAHAPEPFVLLNPGAAWPNKRWPADRFGRMAAWLREQHGLRSVAIWGPHEERLAHDIVRTSSGAAMAAPPTRLADLVALAREARLMISGDTGPTHLAAAVGTPLVSLFGPTNARRNGPWSPDDIALERYASCECHYERRCRREDAQWCLGTITEDDVRAAVTKRLR